MELNQTEQSHLLTLLQQKFMSSYKILYMIDQKEADNYKKHHSVGCCSKEKSQNHEEDSPIVKIVKEITSESFLVNNMDQILDFCMERFQNIVEGGKKENMVVTNDVQKFLIDKVLSEGVNHYLYKQALDRISKQSARMGSQMGLWATPATWYAKYPNVKLELFSSNNLSQLHHQKYTIIEHVFDNQIKQFQDQLHFLEKDGRFEEILWTGKDQGQPKKLLNNCEPYANEGTYFPAMKTVLTLIHSIPFELNEKMNQYLTVADSLKILYYRDQLKETIKPNENCRYFVIVNVGKELHLELSSKNKLTMRNGSIAIISGEFQHEFACESMNEMFLISNSICGARKK